METVCALVPLIAISSGGKILPIFSALLVKENRIYAEMATDNGEEERVAEDELRAIFPPSNRLADTQLLIS